VRTRAERMARWKGIAAVSVYIDLSEFLANPVTTGIQRVVCELCKHLQPQAAIPVRLESGNYVALSGELISAIARNFATPSEHAALEIRRLAVAPFRQRVNLSSHDTLFVPEVFYNPERIAFFRSMPDHQWRRIRFLVHDLLPLTHPQFFHPDAVLSLYTYYQLIRKAAQCAFVSETTRDSYYQYLRRTDTPAGLVIAPGSDSFGARGDSPASNRPLTFTVLGTIEPRKNHALILDAFEPLLRQSPDLRLIFIGNMGWVDTRLAERVKGLASNLDMQFLFLPSKDDTTIRTYLEQSRATIYVSSAEGYGLPPVESLWAGTPVIASASIPSLRNIGDCGVHYVEPLTASNLVRAVLSFLNDDYANAKTRETAHLNLPRWKAFTDQIIRWCLQDAAISAV
jgi:glycosyltransferase involved in cell wall biosynthesis